MQAEAARPLQLSPEWRAATPSASSNNCCDSASHAPPACCNAFASPGAGSKPNAEYLGAGNSVTTGRPCDRVLHLVVRRSRVVQRGVTVVEIADDAAQPVTPVIVELLE